MRIPPPLSSKRMNTRSSSSKIQSFIKSNHEEAAGEKRKRGCEQEEFILDQLFKVQVAPEYIEQASNITLYSNIHKRHILDASICKWETFDQPSLRVWIENQNWVPFLEIDAPVFPMLVRQFYKTLTVDFHKNLLASVNGTLIKINSQIMNQIIGTPDFGRNIVKGRYSIDGKNYDRLAFLNSIFPTENGILPPRLPGSHLKPGFKELHQLLGQILIPHSSSHGGLSHHDTYIMWCICNGIHVNLGFCIIDHISQLNGNASLPYSMFLTKIFQHFKVSFIGQSIQAIPLKIMTGFQKGPTRYGNYRGLSTVGNFLSFGGIEKSIAFSDNVEKCGNNALTKENINVVPAVVPEKEASLSLGLSLNSRYCQAQNTPTSKPSASSKGKNRMAFSSSNFSEYDELLSPEESNMANVIAGMQNLSSPQPSQTARFESHLLDALQCHPRYPTPDDVGRTNTGTPVTLEVLMGELRKLGFSLDSGLGHTHQLYVQAKEALARAQNPATSSGSSSGKESHSMEALMLLMQENTRDVKQALSILKEVQGTLVDHGNTMIIVESTLHDLYRKQKSTDMRMASLENITLEMGTAIQHIHTTQHPQASCPSHPPQFHILPDSSAPRFP